MRPNIIFILIDDMGWRDLSCYGSSFYETPNLDRLAAAGMRFTNAYAACPVCSPTRASIMSGRYPATLALTDWIDSSGKFHPLHGKLVDAPYVKQLATDECSLARALQEGGYATWHVGKWHLGGRDYWPDRHGFDINIAGCHMGHPTSGYRSPYNIPTLPDGPAGEYLTDRLTDEAIRLIQNHDGARPFFLNLWHYAVHTPIQAPEPLLRKYQQKAQQMGLDPAAGIVEGEPMPTVEHRNRHVRRRIIQSDPSYAAMVENLDWNIGRLLTALQQSPHAENTMVIFTSDNGGLATAEGSPTSNLPLSEGKGWMYEGGVREPLIAWFPGVIRAGSVTDAPVTSPDFYPTLLDAADLPPRPAQHRDGVSMWPLLRSQPHQRGPIFWHYPHYGNQGGTPACSVRFGQWKLIEFFEDGRLELYDLDADPGEKTNLAASHRATADRLHALLVDWRVSVEARLPLPNRALA